MSTEVLYRPFDIETHKKTFTNYLEVIILEDGTVTYATPSHQEKLIQLARERHNLSRDEVSNLCPEEYYCDFMVWLCQITGAVALWNEMMQGYANEKQKEVIEVLKREGLYHGLIYEKG